MNETKRARGQRLHGVGEAFMARRLRLSLGPISAFAIAWTTATASHAAPPQGDGADPAHAGPSRAACLNAHHEAQELRKAGKLVEAGKELLICASATCPGPIISDCGTWTSELEEATPSMVFEVEIDGRVASDVKVSVDGVAVSDWSHAVPVNPGSHAVRVEVPSFGPHEETVFMAEGHRMRLVSVKFETPKTAPAPAASTEPLKSSAPLVAHRPVPVVVYPLLAAGIAGLAGFGVFDGLGWAKQVDLQKHCEPRCTDEDLKPMKTDYLIGDIALGVGVAALAGAAVVYFTRPQDDRTSPSVVSFGIGPTGADARRKSGGWEASATMRW
jgi:hypothetical protein